MAYQFKRAFHFQDVEVFDKHHREPSGAPFVETTSKVNRDMVINNGEVREHLPQWVTDTELFRLGQSDGNIVEVL